MPHHPTTTALGKRLQEARKRAKLKRAQTAQDIGVATSTLQNWEEGRGSPQTTQLSHLCELYDCSADYLLMRTETPDTRPALGQFLIDEGIVSAILDAKHWDQIEAIIDPTPPLVTFWMQVQEGSRWLTRAEDILRIEKKLDAKLRKLADTRATKGKES